MINDGASSDAMKLNSETRSGSIVGSTAVMTAQSPMTVGPFTISIALASPNEMTNSAPRCGVCEDLVRDRALPDSGQDQGK